MDWRPIIMKKVFGSIGKFFAKIGRWIANTAWVQPLLIVGGIFAIIFSIPAIKGAIDRSKASKKIDEQLVFLTSHAIDLTGAITGDSVADKLFTALEDFEDNPDSRDYIENTFGSKFFLTFAKKTCEVCKDTVDGFVKLQSDFVLDHGFNYYTIMLDELYINEDDKDNNGKYLAKFLFENHQTVLDHIAGGFAEGATKMDYALFKNISSSEQTSMKNSILKLATAVDDFGEGLDTPTTFMIDLNYNDKKSIEIHGVSAIFFNYTNLITDSTLNSYTKAQFLEKCWNYSDIFDPDYEK